MRESMGMRTLPDTSMGVDVDLTLRDISLADHSPHRFQRQIHLTQGSVTASGHVGICLRRRSADPFS